jgi:hypothetical protein
MKNDLHTPQEIRHQIWKELGRATQDRHHGWRTPVLATSSDNGLVNARTVVLREVDVVQSNLVIYTDERSAKVSEMLKQQAALFVVWSGRLNWQLRVRVKITVSTNGLEVEQRWQRVSQTAAANDYLGQDAPGTVKCESVNATMMRSQKNYFTVLNATVTEMDWLELGRSGHRRARILTESWEWLTP